MAVLNEEQTMLRDMARSWAQKESPVSAFRKVRNAREAAGFDRAAYKEIADMGWTGIIIPEAYGGSGLGYLSAGLVIEELGKTLTASPLAASNFASASALILAGSDAQKAAWLPKLASGKAIATLAVDEGPRRLVVVVRRPHRSARGKERQVVEPERRQSLCPRNGRRRPAHRRGANRKGRRALSCACGRRGRRAQRAPAHGFAQPR